MLTTTSEKPLTEIVWINQSYRHKVFIELFKLLKNPKNYEICLYNNKHYCRFNLTFNEANSGRLVNELFYAFKSSCLIQSQFSMATEFVNKIGQLEKINYDSESVSKTNSALLVPSDTKSIKVWVRIEKRDLKNWCYVWKYLIKN
jgi:hypothetical protein